MAEAVRIFEEGIAILWVSGLAVDADGSPRAYHPDSKSGLDRLANAGDRHPTRWIQPDGSISNVPTNKPDPKSYVGEWWALATDLEGNPYVQKPTDPAPGFYVSTTSLQDKHFRVFDPRRYVHAEMYPYVTATREMLKLGAAVGDLAIVQMPGLDPVGTIVADVGPSPGEGSIRLAEILGVIADPRRGGTNLPVRFTILRGTEMGWPRSTYVEDALQEFQKWGGATRFAATLGG